MRPRFPVAVHLFFLKERQVLLARRYNTGWEDGKYGVPAGHVENGETVTQAALREAREEVGLTLDPSDVEIVHVMHRRSEEPRVDWFFLVKHWTGEIVNHEPDKCDDLSWYPLTSPPTDMIPYVRQALEYVLSGIHFSEFGW